MPIRLHITWVLSIHTKRAGVDYVLTNSVKIFAAPARSYRTAENKENTQSDTTREERRS